MAGITVVGGRRNTAKLLHGGVQPALELEIIIGIQDVMLPVVLVLVHDFHLAELVFEQVALRLRTAVAVKGVPAPF